MSDQGRRLADISVCDSVEKGLEVLPQIRVSEVHVASIVCRPADEKTNLFDVKDIYKKNG